MLPPNKKKQINVTDELPQVVCANCYLKLSEIDTYFQEICTVQKQLQTELTTIKKHQQQTYRKISELSSNSSSSTRHLDLSNKLMRLDDENLVYLECTKCNNLKFEDQETFDTHLVKFHGEPLTKINNNSKTNNKSLIVNSCNDTNHKNNENIANNSSKKHIKLLLEDSKIDYSLTKCHDSYKNTSQIYTNNDDIENMSCIDIKIEDDVELGCEEIVEGFNMSLVEDYAEIITTEEFLEESSLQSYILEDEDDEIETDDNSDCSGKTLFSCSKTDCNMGFQTQFALILHLAEAHEEKTLFCNQCSLKFNNFEEYVLHRKVEVEETKLFNEIMNSEDTIEKNYEIVEKSGSYKFMCKLCRRQFNQKFNYEKHKCKSAEFGVKKCLDCNQDFSSNREMFKHRQSHLAENISCTLCDKKFKSYDGLKYHLKVHVFKGSKSIDCPYCDRKFIARVNLNAHMKQLHSNLKMYRCSYEKCDKVFATFDHLRKHEIVHLNIRKYPCSYCKRSFFQMSHKREHERTQHKPEKDKEMFACGFNGCTMICSTKYVLKRHIYRKHRQEEQ